LSALRSPAVVRALAELHAQAEREDPEAKQRVLDREAELGKRLAQPQRYELYGSAPLAIVPEVGELMYVLCRARHARLAVEFGCSLGISTIYLAAAVRDGGQGGSVITSELEPAKAGAAYQNLAAAGLDELVELRTGDALETLGQMPRPVDVLFLDGRNDQYLPVLKLVEPSLAPAALVIADLNEDDPDLDPYLEYVRDPGNGYASVLTPLGDGVELSIGAEKGRRAE
jgi:predicted O-methyltransferase YrrM